MAQNPPNWEQVIAQQTQILQALTQTVTNLQQTPQAPPPQRSRDKYGDFIRSGVPTFSYAVEPLDADDWLKTVEKKLKTLQCSDREKVLYAAGQLTGAANDWWEAYCSAHTDPDTITWAEFIESFRGYHVPKGTIQLKRKEFLDLKQGSMTVNDYVNKFTQLSRYAPEDVNTDAKKQDCFMEGLNYGLQVQLVTHEFTDFQSLVNKALVLENKRRQLDEVRKRKMAPQG